ncbi:Retrovirus-related Pol polyprotein from transposon TNT 1-94 [Trichinella sp. T8]|nr:Retrovirus-related Pol polyprotein from transposon TNT 1-94 [Trichinella sp. T8]
MDLEIADDLLSILLLYAIPDSYGSFRAIGSRDELPKPEMTHQDCYPDKTSEISLCIGGRSNLKWCLDSGASSHMCSNKEMFLSMKSMKRTLSLANNKSTEIMGTGTANLEIPGSDGMRSVKLHNTLYVPDLRSNLLSVAKITEKGFQLPPLKTHSPRHRRLGHLNEKSLLELTRHEKVFGMKVSKEKLPKFLRVNGIRHETSVQYTPQQNGVAERKNRTLLDMARCMLLESKLSLNFWAEAISTACYIRNRCPSKSLNGEVQHTTKECIFIGYSTESKAYRLWCPAERKVFKSRDLKFTGKFGNDETLHQLTTPNQEWPANDTREKENETFELQLTPNESNETHQSGGTLVQNEPEQVTKTRKMKVLPRRPRLVRSGRRGRPKKVYQKEEVQPVPCEDVVSIAEMNDPKSVAEALSCDESKEWLEAMKREYEALVKNNTWEIVNRPQRQKVITCQWVYNTKFNADGSIKQRKARLVAKGFLQRSNIDFHETYAPVARLSSIRTILAISANYGLIAHQLDFVSAYLNGEIEEEIYMEIPEKLDESDNQSELKLAKNPVFHARTKHIDIRYHFIREAAERKDVELRYLPTEQMISSCYITKGLFKPKHEKCISEIGLENLCGESPKQFNNVGEVLGHIVD